MSVLNFYYDLLSQPSRAIYIFLKITNIPFQAHPVPLRKREHLTEEFKKTLNRFQKVPFIHHGDFILAESIGILRYLVREYRPLVSDHWYPEDTKAQAKVDEYLEWQHLNTRLKCASYFWHKWVLPISTQSPPDEVTVAQLESDMVSCLDEIEELWLSQGHKYIVGDTITVADIFAACELEQPKVAGFDVTRGRPILKNWLDRVREDCNPFYDEAHSIVYKAAEKNKAKL